MMKKRFLKWHKRLALLMAIPVLMWSLSGLLHPLMANWMKPSIAKRFIPPSPIRLSDKVMSPSEALKSHDEIHQFRLISLSNKPVYLAITPDQKQHFHNALTGELIKNGAEQYTEQLARSYLDDQQSSLVKITMIDSFGGAYGNINRLLPVYRVELDRADGIQAVVDPRTSRLASYDSPSKRVFATLFDWCHRWSFLGHNHSILRISVVLLVSCLALFTALTGIANIFLFRTKRTSRSDDGTQQKTKRKLGLRRSIHRLSGSIAFVFFLMFGISGIYHIAAKYSADDSTSWVSSQKVKTQTLTLPIQQAINSSKKPVSNVSLAVIHDKAYYRLTIMDRSTKGLSKMVSAQSLAEVKFDDQYYAKQLALEFSGYDDASIKETEIITQFRSDYGFIFKRLPVWRVSFADSEYWHYTVDTADAHMAMRTSPASLVEALSFVNLHKFHFLDPISKNLRDYVTAIGVLLISFVTLLGLSLLRRKRRPAR